MVEIFNRKTKIILKLWKCESRIFRKTLFIVHIFIDKISIIRWHSIKVVKILLNELKSLLNCVRSQNLCQWWGMTFHLEVASAMSFTRPFWVQLATKWLTTSSTTQWRTNSDNKLHTLQYSLYCLLLLYDSSDLYSTTLVHRQNTVPQTVIRVSQIYSYKVTNSKVYFNKDKIEM